MKAEVFYKNSKPYMVCPKCKGTGKVIDHALGVFTFGLGYLVQALDPTDREECPKCGGTGGLKL